MTLADFLLARIAEDEQAAHAAIDPADPAQTDAAGHWEFIEYEYEGIWPEPPRERRPDAVAQVSDVPWIELGYNACTCGGKS